MKEKIKSSAIKIGEKIYTGKRHCDCFQAAYDAGEEAPRNEIQGFVTESGRFVGRREAREIAIKAGQTTEERAQKNILYSEDIY